MDGIFDLAIANLGSPLILSFALGVGAALARADLSVPEAAAKALSIYLLFAIGFKGGVSVAEHGADALLVTTLMAGVALSAGLPLLAFRLLRRLSDLDDVNAAAVAAHYGSISIVTFVAATTILTTAGLQAEGFMVAVAAAMEAPAIVSALWLLRKSREEKGEVAVAEGGGTGLAPELDGDDDLWREILLNGSIVLLVGAFVIGMITGTEGLAKIDAFIVAPFAGVLCLFLLDMGLVAGRNLRQSHGALSQGLLAFGVIMPLAGAACGAFAGAILGLSTGGVMLLMTLSASASYIAVPAAMRVAVPEADPGIYLTLSLGITFPFNLTLGLPIYLSVARSVTGG